MNGRDAVLRLLRRDPELEANLLKVLLPRRLGRFESPIPGHRAIHLVGDWGLGVGLLATRPTPTATDLRNVGVSWSEIRSNPYVEADYVAQGDFIIYAAPNEYTNPYVIGARRARDAQRLGRTFEQRAAAILRSVRRGRVEELRGKMPFVSCARCHGPARWFMVSNEEWARVGPQWLRTVLCPDCYGEVTGAPIPA